MVDQLYKTTNVNNYLKIIKKDIERKNNPLHFLSKSFSLDLDKKKLLKFKKFKSIVVVGMGGSILGLKAIYSSLRFKIKKKVKFLDNLNPNQLDDLLKDKYLNKNLFILISKSGNTLETLTNISILSNKIKLNNNNTIVITEKKESALFDFARKKNIYLVEHKTFIGGRFSVLSEAGMIPAYIMGLNVNKFRSNLLNYFKKSKRNTLLNNSKDISQKYLTQKYNSIIFLSYSSQLNDLILWCQQLISESLGKKNKGLLPVLSKAPRDHHSLLQLYLDGPKDKIFYIFSGENTTNIKIKKNLFNKNINFIKNKKIEKIINAQKKALLKTIKKNNIPVRDYQIKKFSEENLSKLFTYFILETVLVAKVINVNPFNQPAVEQVKQLTKKQLSN